jgi:hypothetical protein
MNLQQKLMLVAWTPVALLFFCGITSAALAGSEGQEESGDEILARITELGRDFEQAYLGSYSRRTLTARVSDAEDGELKLTRNVVVDVWDYHGEQPINEVIKCRINDKAVDLAKCVQKQRLEPPYRLFGDDAEKHYRFEYLGRDSWKGQASYKIKLIPLEETVRHLKGEIFFREDTLRLAGMNLTLADFPFALKALSIELNFEERNGVPLIKGGSTTVHIYIPFLINQRTVTQFTASEQRMLKERHTASR